jgi:phage tail sheath protein FI
VSQELLSSKVVIVEESPQVRGIPSFSTSVAGAVGITERGPVGLALLCTSFGEYVRKFGGFTPDSDLTLAAAGFFENGGTQLWVVRTAHYADPLDAATVLTKTARGYVTKSAVPTPAILTSTARAPFSLLKSTTLQVHVNGADPQPVSFSGEAAALLIRKRPPFTLQQGLTLQIQVDDAQAAATVTFPLMEVATPEAIAAVLADQLKAADVQVGPDGVTVQSRRKGSSSVLDVVGGTAIDVLKPETVTDGAGSVADLAHISGDEFVAAFAALAADVAVSVLPDGTAQLQTVRTGSDATLQLEGDGASVFGLATTLHTGADVGDLAIIQIQARYPGTYGNGLSVAYQPVDDHTFNLRVFDGGLLRETWPGLSLDTKSGRFATTILNDDTTGSSLIRVVVQPNATTIPAARIALAGGDDGLQGLVDTDFIGNDSARSGLRALDRVQDLSIVLVPGQATPGVHEALVQYCEVVRDGLCFAVLDPPEGMSATAIVDYVDNTAALGGLTEHAAIYWPRVQVLNPNRQVFGTDPRIFVSPSGIIAGVYARVDGARPGGVYDPPAGTENGRMLGVLGFETDEVLEEPARDVVYPHRINPLTTQPGFPRYIDGSRTLKGDGNFPFVSERRGVAFISRSLKIGLQFAKHRANDERLRSEVDRSIRAFLVEQMKQRAFRTQDPDTAFFVDVSEDVDVIFRGELQVRVGLATQRPAEWIVITISEDTRALDTQAQAA